MIRAALTGVLALALAGCVTTPSAPEPPEARAYAVTADPMGEVDAALARAAASDKRVLLVMGANWCHDSRALAGWLQSPRFAPLVARRFEVVYVDIGIPQTGKARNLEIAQRFGLAEFRGTPALLVLTAEGRAVNLDTATRLRDAASRREAMVFAELLALAEAAPPPAS